MKVRFLTILLVLAFQQQSFAQSNPLDKKLEKATELYKKNKLDDAEKYLENLLGKDPQYGAGWDLLMSVRYSQYEEAKKYDGFMSNVTVVTKDENGKELPAGDSLAQQLSKLLEGISPSKRAYGDFVNTLRKATLVSDDAWKSSAYLRMLFVDVDVDSNVNKKALKFYHEAEETFGEKNYTKAAKLYRRAIEEQPDFYKARLYLGDCHYAAGNFADAAVSFKEARDKFPFLLEPRKYLSDAYANLDLYDKALDEAIQSLTVYPDIAMFHKVDYFASMDHKRLDLKWTPRGVFPNKIEDTSTSGIVLDDDDIDAKGPWVYYQAAYKKIEPYCNSKGMIVKQNSLTKAKYMEVYAWEEMLKNSDDPILNEARRMQKLGQLDCYVMVTCFHYDLYDQYKHFVASNGPKVIDFYKGSLRVQ